MAPALPGYSVAVCFLSPGWAAQVNKSKRQGNHLRSGRHRGVPSRRSLYNGTLPSLYEPLVMGASELWVSLLLLLQGLRGKWCSF